MKIKDSLDLNGWVLSNFCIQSDSDLDTYKGKGRKLLYSGNATDEKHNREVIMGLDDKWRVAAYLDDIAAIQEQLDLLSGEVDTDSIISNMKEVSAFLAGFAEDANLMDVLNGKLDKTGGTLTGDLKIQKADGESTLLLGTKGRVYYNESSLETALYNAGDGYPAVKVKAGTAHPIFRYDSKDNVILHSGNIGEYNAGGLVSEYLSDVNAAGYNKVFSSGFQATNRPSENYATGLTIYNAELKYTYQLAFSTSGKLFARYNNNSAWQDWKTIAFMDSNVASATKLETPRTIWGQPFDGTGNVDGNMYPATTLTNYCGTKDNSWFAIYTRGIWSPSGQNFNIGANDSNHIIINSSGNVTIGAGDLAGSDYKLFVHGGFRVRSTSAGGNLGTKFAGASAFGAESYGLQLWTTTTGETLLQTGRFDGNSAVYPICLNPLGGNVLIGTTDDNGSGAKLYVAGLLRTDGNIHIGQQSASDTTQRYLYFWKGDGTYSHRGMMGVHEGGAFWNYYNPKNGIFRELVIGPNGLAYANNNSGTAAFTINSYGNVLIGTTTDNGAKLQVEGTTASIISLKRTTTGGSFIDYFKNNESNNQWRVGHDHGSNGSSFRFNKFSGTTENTVMSILENGNVGIGTTEPKVPLDVMGSVIFGKSNSCNVYLRRNGTNYINAGYNDTEAPNASIALTTGGKGSSNIALSLSNTRAELHRNTTINGDLHVTGNIIADKEVSAGGAAEESGEGGGGTGGGVEPFYKTFTPSTTTVTINHNISSRNVIVQVYEQDSQLIDVWHAVLVDIEIVNDTTVNLHFGRTETTEHKVVIIG